MTPRTTARLLRRHEYVEMPWRNGGGVTFEIAREPQTGAEFTWRLSLALIERSGPFSSFAHYQRAIALVAGEGCHLHGIEQQPVSLRKPGDLRLFPGSVPVHCELIGGVCTDFNLMVREPGCIISARHVSLEPQSSEPLLAECDTALFCLDGDLECVDTESGRRIMLGLHDTFVSTGHRADHWVMRNRGTKVAQLLVLAWRNDHPQTGNEVKVPED